MYTSGDHESVVYLQCLLYWFAEPNDYPQVVSRVITFPGSMMGGIEECTPIAVVDDGIDETPDNENFFLDLTPGTNSAIGNPGRATVTIIDARSKFS